MCLAHAAGLAMLAPAAAVLPVRPTTWQDRVPSDPLALGARCDCSQQLEGAPEIDADVG